MYYYLLALTFAVILLCIFLVSNRKYLDVLLIYVFGCIFVRTINSFYNSVGYLGLGKEWSFLDLVFLVILIILFHLIRIGAIEGDRKEVSAMIVILLLAAINCALGFVFPDHVGVLGFLRKFLFLPIFFIALFLFKERSDIEKFFNLIFPVVILVFIFHVLVAFRFVTIPLPEELELMLIDEGASFLRVELFFSPLIYVIAFSVYLCRIIYSKGSFCKNLIVCFVSAFGVILTQTRAYYLSLVIVFCLSLLTTRKFLKIGAVALFCAVLVWSLCIYYDVDLFYRFTGVNKPDQGVGYFNSWRGREFFEFYDEILQMPLTVFTGQGFGAIHNAPFSTVGVVNFFHNEFLKVFSSLGALGLVCHLFVLVRGAFLSRKFTGHPDVGPLLMPGSLVLAAGLPSSFFGGFFWHPGFGPLVMRLLAINANRSKFLGQYND